MEPSTGTARELVTALVAGGVHDVVLSPGSRSAPLAYALQSAARAGWLTLHVRIDERSAGFVALGLARSGPAARDGRRGASGPGRTGTDVAAQDGGSDPGLRPVAVVTTSGTAVANLHPAVLEAAHAHVPLVVVSADRPHEMRGTGANQTTDQVGIFAGAPRYSADIPAGTPGGSLLTQVVTRALAAATGARSNDPGPVHLNVALRDPLAPAAPWVPGPAPAARRVVAPVGPPPATELSAGPRTVVLAGDGAGPGARVLAEEAGWPLLAEPSSGARSGRNAVGPYRLLLDEARLGRAIERVVVMGHPTLSRPVSRLLARDDVEVVVVAPAGAWTDVAGTATTVVGGVRTRAELAGTSGALAGTTGAPAAAEEWLGRWQRAGELAQAAVDALLDDTRQVDGLVLAQAVAVASDAPGAPLLVLGSSNTIRDVDLVARPWDGPVVPLANRGLAGIDGTVSTATGLALGTGRPVRAVMGDLTFLHDAGGLLRGTLEAEVDLQVVVLNDGGGGIFSTLEHGAPGRAGEFERIFGTPQHADLAALAAGYGAAHSLVGSTRELGQVLRAPVRGRSVVEVRTSRAHLRDRRAAVAEAVRAAIATL
ncbi:2-succinyl-5-enolpyruvyl-6-hydroxy-3-cyclohexene-1-carboxylic-acid synthase [Georgenia sp. M64]|uniref:2-succinyl-5-enolpyruvyl-6-hydroxy-3- cyclohexene-1-carboxylic-acid synthase n=1 Tax=Georgenia sp. M64 TaxID=3120520 RepID=UPI0030E29B20